MEYKALKERVLFWKEQIFASEDQNLKARLLSSGFWALIGSIISRGSILLAFILVARILGKESYGEFGMIRSTANMFVMFAGFGLGMTATKHVAEYKKVDPVHTARILILSNIFAFVLALVVAVLVFFSSSWLAKNSINAPHLVMELKISSLVLFFSAISGAQLGALVGFEAFRSITIVNIYTGLFSFITLIIGAYFYGLSGTVLALALNVMFSCLLHYFYIRKEAKKYGIPYFVNDWWKARSILWQFSLPATLGGIMVSPIMWYCNTLLVKQPDGFNKMGLFDAAFQWYTLILFIPALIGKIILPILSDLNGKENDTEYFVALKINLMVNLGIASFIALIVMLFSPWIMSVYGNGFENGSFILIILACSAILVSVNNVVGQAIASKGKMWSGMLLNLLWALAMVSSSWILIKAGYGAQGLAGAYLISYLLHGCIQLFYFRKVLFPHKKNHSTKKYLNIYTS